MEREHRVITAQADGRILRVLCETCGSQHNFRGSGPAGSGSPGEALPIVSQREAAGGAETGPAPSDLESLLRRVLREERGHPAVVPAERWRGGTLVLRPGKPGVQEKVWPIETFFHKVVMLRNRLRVLEQQINSAEIPEELKLKLQSYITGCYGSLTSFNVLFASDADRFHGVGGE
jgi:hypothetical protein